MTESLNMISLDCSQQALTINLLLSLMDFDWEQLTFHIIKCLPYIEKISIIALLLTFGLQGDKIHEDVELMTNCIIKFNKTL